ncbi:MAG: putative membrane protein [Planctomycetota bacterium]|jgi:uncharacterized membrane protein
MSSDPLYLLAALALIVAITEWLCRHTFLRHLGTALLVIILTAIVANLGWIPTYSDDIRVYSGTFKFLAPLAIFWLLLGVRLKDVLKAGKTMILLFLIGSLGTALGVIVGMHTVGGKEAIGELYYAIAGMFVGTYTGGSVNFNAIALEYGVVKEGGLYAGAAAVDSLMTTIWMAVNLIIPRVFSKRKNTEQAVTAVESGVDDDTESVHPVDLAWLLALGGLCVAASNTLAAWLKLNTGFAVPSILILTTFALVLAQLPIIARLRGARLLGMFAVYIFLAVIGALCDISALRSIGDLGVTLFLFACIVVTVHGLLIYGAAALLRVDPVVASVASQANVGGGTSALAVARSLGRPDLVLPSILIGALGSALGTYLGFLTAEFLR